MAERDETLTKIMPIKLDDLYDKYKYSKPADDDLVIFNGQIVKFKDIETVRPTNPADSGQAPGSPGESAEFAKPRGKSLSAIEDIILKENDYIDGLYDQNRPEIENTVDLKQLEKLLSKADNYGEAILNLRKYKSGREKTWQQYLTLAALIGENSIHEQIKAVENESESESQFAEWVDDDFYFLKPKEAIKYFKRKLPIPKAVWNQITEEMKDFAFYVSQLEDTGLINFALQKMIEALEDGKTYQTFTKELFEVSGTRQFFGHQRTAFYTNMYTALSYQNGVAMLRNVDRYPYWRYSAVMDNRTRPEHAAWHGFVARYDDKFWDVWFPLNGYNCRCRATIASNPAKRNISPGSEEQLKNLKIKTDEISPDKGFERSPIHNLRQNTIKLLNDKKGKTLNLNKEIRGKIAKIQGVENA
jgi:SPP1 gp7 family putative phage head morphogenesis protein